MALIRLGSIEMGDYDRDRFIVISRLLGRSIRANIASALAAYLRRNAEQHDKMLNYTARKYGLTADELWRRLLLDESLGEPDPNFIEPSPELEN